jgi:cold shock CspA family protein
MNGQREFGVVNKYHDVRGFGFIHSTAKNGVITRYFLHKSKITSGEPKFGAIAYFDIGEGRPGKAKEALNVTIGPVLPKFATTKDSGGAL